MQEFAKYDAMGLAELVKNKDVKPIELVEAAITRIESVNDKLACVNIKNYENARAQAEGDVPDGPFSGVPLLLKDLITVPLEMLSGKCLTNSCDLLGGLTHNSGMKYGAGT